MRQVTSFILSSRRVGCPLSYLYFRTCIPLVTTISLDVVIPRPPYVYSLYHSRFIRRYLTSTSLRILLIIFALLYALSPRLPCRSGLSYLYFYVCPAYYCPKVVLLDALLPMLLYIDPTSLTSLSPRSFCHLATTINSISFVLA
jgi:hypothetical protein